MNNKKLVLTQNHTYTHLANIFIDPIKLTLIGKYFSFASLIFSVPFLVVPEYKRVLLLVWTSGINFQMNVTQKQK